MKKFLIRLIKKCLGVEEISVEWLRKKGAIVGEDVDLYSFNCSGKDATCLEIGNHVTLTGVHIITHDASLKRFIGNDCNKVGRVVIGNNVFVGMHTIILPNVRIGNNVIIGAGSVVSSNIPDNSVAVGNPAKVICTCDEMLEKHRKRMVDDNVYRNLNRSEMSNAERIRFNKEIDGRIVYLIDDDE